MKQITLWLPKDDLRKMASGKIPTLTFQTDELGFPLRITLEPKESNPIRKFGGQY